MTILMYFIISVQFERVAYFPYGSPGDFLYATDCDHDGNYEFFCEPDTATYYSEHIGGNQYEITYVPWFHTIAVGNGDGDSLTDAFGMIAHPGHISETLAVYESANYDSFPDSLVWLCEDTIAHYVASGIFVDFDQDTKMNLITDCGRNFIYIFENSGDNVYVKRYQYTSPVYGMAKYTVSDFDLDGLLELVCGDIDGRVYVFESAAIGVDSFQQVWSYQIPGGVNAFITTMGHDMDRDGRAEFIVGCKDYYGSSFTIFESIGNNSYEETWNVSYTTGGSLTYGDVDCGDVDGDGIDEMITFGGLLLYVWKCVGPDSFIQIWEHDFYCDLTCARLLVHDLNQNGLDEIVVSGFNYVPIPPLETYIYEYVPPGITEETNIETHGVVLEIYPNPFRHSTDIRYQKSDNGQQYELKIYDITGRLVTALSEQVSVSNHQLSVRWDGTDNHGNRRPAGVYFVCVQSPSGEQSVPVVLLR